MKIKKIKHYNFCDSKSLFVIVNCPIIFRNVVPQKVVDTPHSNQIAYLERQWAEVTIHLTNIMLAKQAKLQVLSEEFMVTAITYGNRSARCSVKFIFSSVKEMTCLNREGHCLFWLASSLEDSVTEFSWEAKAKTRIKTTTIATMRIFMFLSIFWVWDFLTVSIRLIVDVKFGSRSLNTYFEDYNSDAKLRISP